MYNKKLDVSTLQIVNYLILKIYIYIAGIHTIMTK